MPQLLDLIPPHDLYVEVFTGSGVLFFNKEPTKSILNDLDKDVVYRLKLLKKVPLFEKKEVNNLDTVKKMYDKPIKTLEDAVIREKIKACNGFNGKLINKSSMIYNTQNPYSISTNLPIYKSLLKHATITNKDYKNILEKYDSPNTFFYLDPPYENTHKDFYEDNFINYEEMRDILLQLKGFFLLSINDSPYTRKVFKDFIIKKISIFSTWSNNNNKTEKKRKELLIMNYKLK
jgi:DNA adenine methylase